MITFEYSNYFVGVIKMMAVLRSKELMVVVHVNIDESFIKSRLLVFMRQPTLT